MQEEVDTLPAAAPMVSAEPATPEEEREARWLASEDEHAPPPWSALGAFAQLLAAVVGVGLLLVALLGVAGVATWILR